MSEATNRANRAKKDISGEEFNPDDLLDTKEQQDIIQKFVEQNASTNAWFQNIITLAGLGFAAAKAYYLFSHILFPWYLQPHALYVDTVPWSVVVFWDFLSTLSFLLIALAMHPAFGIGSVEVRRGMHFSAGISYILYFATWILYRGLDFSPEVIWFMGGNIATHALALYAEYLIADSARQIGNLQRSQYKFHKA